MRNGPVTVQIAPADGVDVELWTKIEPPVYVRPRWRSPLRLRKENTYHFVLWNGDRISLVSVLDCPEIERLLAENHLAVDRL
jgi:hypothetical protein